LEAFFFDSSALVKFYISEIGTGWVKSLGDPLAGNRIYLARIAGVEVVSAIIRRQRAGAIAANDAASALADFLTDFANEYVIAEVDAALVSDAMGLAERHALRGYDAIQLAAALTVNRQRLAVALPAPTLISADRALNTAAVVEGLVVDDPNYH
jgi:predicted nucleic acid-binding protein